MIKISKKIFRIFIWAIATGAFCFVVLAVLGIYSAKKTGVGLCAPGGKIESMAMSPKNVRAEMHMCPDIFLSYHYYLETSPPAGLFERRPVFGEGQPPPSLEWTDDKTLRIVLPKKMFHEATQTYNGIQIIYEDAN